MRWIGRQLLRFRTVRIAIQDRAPLGRFRPDRRFRWGVWLVGLGILTGWPAVALLGAIALSVREPHIIAYGGPITYVFSWIVYLAGLALAGMAALKYMRVLNRWLLRKTAEWLLGGRRAALMAVPAWTPDGPDSTERQPSRQDVHEQEDHVQLEPAQDAAIEQDGEAGRELVVGLPEREGHRNAGKGFEP